MSTHGLPVASPLIPPYNTEKPLWSRYLDLRGLVGRLGDSAPDDSSTAQYGGTYESDMYARPRALELKYGITAAASDDFRAAGKPPPGGPTMKSTLQSFIDRGLGDKVRAIKLGDEITLARPAAVNNSADAGFHSWAKAKGLTAKEIGCTAFDANCHYGGSAPRGANPLEGVAQTNPALFYYSNLYASEQLSLCALLCPCVPLSVSR